MKARQRFIHLAVRVALSAIAVGAANGARAQAVAAGGEDVSAKPAAESIETITVTAQRRSQRISDVPISVSSVTGESLAERGITALHEVAEQLPGVQVQRNQQGMPTWMIRGVGLIDFSPNNNPSAAVFQDDVYQVSTALSQLSMFDVGRVEILKGPQSGIYGRNTSGGAVRIVSNLAEFGETGGNAALTRGSWGTYRVGGAVGSTLAPDVLAARLAFDGTWGGEGRMHLLSSDRDWGKQDKQAVRASVLWQAAPGSKVTFIGEVAQDKSQVLPQNAIGYKPMTSASGICSSVLNGLLDNASCRTYGGVVNALNGNPGTNDASTQTPGRTALADPFGEFDVSNKSFTANGDFRLGGMKLVSVTHVRNFDYGRSTDNDGTTGEFGHSVNMTKFKILSQEFRLQSTEPSALQWIAGASFMRDELTENRIFYFRDNTPLVANFAAYGVASASQLIARLAYKQITTSGSVFGQTDYALTDKLNLGLAARWTDEQKEYRDGGFAFPNATGAVSGAVAPIANYQLADDYQLKARWSGKASIDWKPVRELMTYASLSRGFKVGGFFGGFPLNGQTAIQPYREEKVTAYEVGVKTDAANRKVGGSLALFRYDYQDAQNFTTVYSQLLGRTVVRLDNVGRARHDGVEVEGWWRPMSPLRLSAGASHLNARFLDDYKYTTLDGKVVSYQGQKRPFAPRRSWMLGAEYDIAMEAGTVRLGGDVNHRSDLIQNFGSNVDRAITSLPGYTLVNLHAMYITAGGALQYSLIVRNAENKTYAVTYNNDGLGSFTRFYGEPRSVWAEVKYHF